MASIIYVIVWINLHFRLRDRELSLSKGFLLTMFLLGSACHCSRRSTSCSSGAGRPLPARAAAGGWSEHGWIGTERGNVRSAQAPRVTTRRVSSMASSTAPRAGVAARSFAAA